MAVRFRSGRACRTCPQPAQTAIAKAAAHVPATVLTSEAESTRLWKHVLFGTGTCAGMIVGYAKLGLPGDPRGGIKAVIATLTDALRVLEERAGNADQATGS